MVHTTLFRDRPGGLAAGELALVGRVFGEIGDLGLLIGRAYRAAHAVECLLKRSHRSFDAGVDGRLEGVQDTFDRHFRAAG